jgi:hypothetical protein
LPEIVQFKPLAESDAESNLVAFVDLCKHNLSVFGNSLPFDEHVWDVSDYVKAKGKANSNRIYFSSWETVNAKLPQPMPEPFASFAKAYLRYQHAYRPIIDHSARVAPMSAICEALGEIGLVSPVHINSHILNRASQLIVAKNSPARAYRLGQNLQRIAAFADENRFVKVASRWRNPIGRPGDSARVGKEFEDRRQQKLPSAEDLGAVAQAYRLAKEPEDLIVTSIGAIMCSTPDRIAEILTLPAECEHCDRLPDGKEVYGLRYWPAKGAAPMIKWAIPSMVDLVKDAVARIKVHTESARGLARWYEEHPSDLYLPAHLEAHRGEALSGTQAAELIYGNGAYREETLALLKFHKLCPTGIRISELKVEFQILQDFVLSRLPKNFPFLDKKAGLKYSDALCVMHKYEFNQQRRTIRCLFESISHGQVSNGLGGGARHGKSSVFSRLGVVDANGVPFVINTHKFRHYLNTLAMHGGLDELDLAKWSGRKDVRQNRAYDHVSARDRLAMIRKSIGDSSNMFGSLGWAPSVPSITRDEFANLKVTTAHTTEFGYCTHNFTATPCQLHLDCLNCNELVCIKGDETREINIRRQLEETRELLRIAQKGGETGAYGAGRWVDHQTQTLQRLEELCAVFDSPTVQRGAVIQLKHLPTVSKLVQAAQTRGMDLSGGRLQQGESLLPASAVLTMPEPRK